MIGPQPHVDDHIVEPGTREEMLHGRRLRALPAKPSHACLHSRLAYVLEAHLADAYFGALDLLTRTSFDSDFASDASICPADPDPMTGGRQLEELAFEICSRQGLKIPTEKARELIRRGVRRVFCLVVPATEVWNTNTGRSRRNQRSRLLEWAPEADGWSPVSEESMIEDPCFVRPLPVRALFDASEAHEAVADALRMRGCRAFREEYEAGRAEGKAEGMVASLLVVLEARGVAVTAEQKEHIGAMSDRETLDRWLRRAITAASLDEVWE